MSASSAPFGIPYGNPAYWPKDADRDHYRDAARKSCPHAADHLIERLAQALAYTDATAPLSRFNKGLVKIPAPMEQVEAEELAFTRAIPHVVHGMIYVDRAA